MVCPHETVYSLWNPNKSLLDPIPTLYSIIAWEILIGPRDPADHSRILRPFVVPLQVSAEFHVGMSDNPGISCDIYIFFIFGGRKKKGAQNPNKSLLNSMTTPYSIIAWEIVLSP